jgi:hypothetical protein
MKNAGYEFEDFCECFVKGFTKATKEEDSIGVDGYIFGTPVQCKSMIHTKDNSTHGYSVFNPVGDYDIQQLFIIAIPNIISFYPYKLDHENFRVIIANAKDVEKSGIFSICKGGRGAYIQNRKNKAMERLIAMSSSAPINGTQTIFSNGLLR